MNIYIKLMTYSFAILLYMCVGGFFCGLLDEEDHPIVLAILWPVVLVGGLSLVFIRATLKIGSELREKVTK